MNATEGETQGKIIERQEKEEVVGYNTVVYCSVCVFYVCPAQNKQLSLICTSQRETQKYSFIFAFLSQLPCNLQQWSKYEVIEDIPPFI